LIKTTIIHNLSLKSIGGIQRTFTSFSKFANESSEFRHVIYTNHKVDKNYKGQLEIQFKYLKNPVNFFLFCYHLCSKNSIVNFYNNLSSKKVYYLFKIINPTNIIFHERGNAWNIKSNKLKIYKFNSKKSSVIIVNSEASKLILKNKFRVDPSKIQIIYNGVLDNIKYPKKKLESEINVGFIGRLDTNKGVNIFIETAKKLNNFKFNIAGIGPLEKYFRDQCVNQNNIFFRGKIENPYEFLKNQNLLIVPSIREPYGNVIIEAGIMKVPVIAANVDGIPEIIKDGFSGVLIEPTDDLDKNLIQNKSLPFPEVVVNSRGQLAKPKQINPSLLAKEILVLLSDYNKMDFISKNLYSFVKINNKGEKYFLSLEKIFKKLLSGK